MCENKNEKKHRRISVIAPPVYIQKVKFQIAIIAVD